MTRYRRGCAVWLCALLALLCACGASPTTVPANPSSAPTAQATASRSTATILASPTTRPATPAATVSATAGQRGAASTTVAATPTRTAYPLTIQDIAGRRVTIARRPERIVSLAPSATETVFALGLGDRVVGVDASSDYPAAAREKPRIGTFSQPSIEAVVAQSPDLVLAANLHLRSAVPALESRGLTVVVLNPVDLAAVLDSITLVGQLTDSAEAVRGVRGDLERRIAAVEARLPQAASRPRVYVEITAKLAAAGPTSFIGDLIDRAGGSNIVVERGAQYPTLSAEAIIAADPDVIILTNADAEVTVASVGARPGWSAIGAVRQGRVVAIDQNVVTRSGPRAVDALEALARAFHPTVFR